MKSSLKNMVLVLFSITAVSAYLVALVNDLTKETIAATEQANKDKAKLEVLPSAHGTVTYEEKMCKIGDFSVNVTKVSDDGALLGYAVEAPSITTSGYADRIYLMVGFVEDEAGDATIYGVQVLSQKETPGLGAEMIKPGNKLEKSILGMRADELVFKVKKDDATGSFDALTGSTISSRAYTNAVETAYAAYLWATDRLFASDVATPSANENGDVMVTDAPADEQGGYDTQTGATTVENGSDEVSAEESEGVAQGDANQIEAVETVETLDLPQPTAEESIEKTAEETVQPAEVDNNEESETQKGGVDNE